MQIKRLIKYYILGESLKEIEMNRILEKISKKGKLTKRESDFLNLYNETTDEERGRDLMYLSKNVAVKKIKELIEKYKKVICDLHDRNGKIGLQIIDIVDEDNEEETSLVIMRGNETHKLHDKFLYNIIYNTKKNEYSLQEQDEYFEKITVKNED
jgi:hypothetical protein